jgi:hypothetical protein
MMLLGCYSNPDLTFETYEFNEILTVFETVSKRLTEINHNKKPYQNIMNKIHT